MLNTKITYTREYDNIPIEGVLIRRFTHTNEGYGQTKEIALIFYEDWVGRPTEPYFEDDDGDLVCEHVLVTRPLFRYVEVDNYRLQIYEGEKSKYEGENMIDLMDKYCKYQNVKEYYIEDGVYNFVNYDGIKF